MLVARHKARLAMQDQNSDAPEVVRIQKVRRRLFSDGEKPGNSDNGLNIAIEEHKKDLEKAKERWNFDFVEEKPLPGRYEWEKYDKEKIEVAEEKTKAECAKEEPKAEKSED
ncbi:cyclin-dependent kinase inhibitor 1-like isoform X2 [Belonocnema kinseyi]|uniref:cyclin-dependent kinase inhibitor 1-like isoform X2 n=2 Tax=Belonocnema kinseyi TaxID=2817044 RepID=UPI00143CD99E|nr:cyclin-dependent kinase inhibitor 1-like isoform X2 [Belonocnema kinseyi]